MRTRSSTFYLIAAISGVAAPALFTLLSVITASLWPSFDPVHRAISQLALAPYGGIQTAAFYLFSILGMLFIVGFYFNIQRHKLLRFSITLLFLCTFGFLLIGIFPTIPEGSAITLRALIHHITTLAIAITFPFGCFLIAPSLKHDPRWKNLFIYTIAAGVLGIILNVIGGVMVVTHWQESWLGLYERITAGNPLVWLEVMAIRLLLLLIHEKKTKS
jgi:hypothetical membrane protein